MIGRKISHYEILEKLGQGGMGVVYLARDANLDRLAALKFLPPAMADSEEKIARFFQEARAISALNHPHIATIYGIEDTSEYKFLALEYLPGGTLKNKMAAQKARGERASWRLAAGWTAQIGEGLAQAHRRGIIHRDVKPSNILFTEEGWAKIADFGLAKRVSPADSDLTETGFAIGTPRSMSPEQAMGRAADERSDIFSLGIILFELIAGEPPFREAPSATLLHGIVYKPAPPLSRFRNDAPPGLEAVVSKALKIDPAARFQRMEELVTALCAAAGLPEYAATASSSISSTITLRRILPGGHSVRRKPALVAGIAGIVLLAGALGGPLVRFHGRELPVEKRIAVMQFTNIGADPETQPLIDALMEESANSLTRLELHGLSVVPAADIRGEHIASAGEAWRKAGAHLAITGSVSRSGDTVRIMINLAETRTVTQLSTDELETSVSDPALNERAVEKIVRMLQALAAKPRRSEHAPAAGLNRHRAPRLERVSEPAHGMD